MKGRMGAAISLICRIKNLGGEPQAEVRITNSKALKEAFGRVGYLKWWVDTKLMVLLFSLSAF